MRRVAALALVLAACGDRAESAPDACREAVEASIEFVSELRDYLAVGVPAALASGSMAGLNAWEDQTRPLAEAYGNAARECLEGE